MRLLILLVLLLPLVALAENTTPIATPPLYEKVPKPDPDGIGITYLGREIAHVMGHQGADWLERPERSEEEGTAKLIAALNFQPGEIVADLGCGSGYITRQIAPKILPGGYVQAVDIQPEMLDLLGKNMARFKIENVKPILGLDDDPKLPPATTDTIIMVDVYHEFDHPYEMMRRLITALKPGGRIVFVEYRREDPKVAIKLPHKMTIAQVKKEMAIQPEMEFVETIETLPLQHILIFKKAKT